MQLLSPEPMQISISVISYSHHVLRWASALCLAVMEIFGLFSNICWPFPQNLCYALSDYLKKSNKNEEKKSGKKSGKKIKQ